MTGGEPSTIRLRAFRRVLALRCPQCGVGRLLRRYGRLHEGCPECGLVYRRDPGAQTGSMYLSAAVTQVFAVAVIAAVWVLADWSVPRSLAVAMPLVAVFCAVFLPFSQALWVAVDYDTDLRNGESWVEPRP